MLQKEDVKISKSHSKDMILNLEGINGNRNIIFIVVNKAFND